MLVPCLDTAKGRCKVPLTLSNVALKREACSLLTGYEKRCAAASLTVYTEPPCTSTCSRDQISLASPKATGLSLGLPCLPVLRASWQSKDSSDHPQFQTMHPPGTSYTCESLRDLLY